MIPNAAVSISPRSEIKLFLTILVVLASKATKQEGNPVANTNLIDSFLGLAYLISKDKTVLSFSFLKTNKK